MLHRITCITFFLTVLGFLFLSGCTRLPEPVSSEPGTLELASEWTPEQEENVLAGIKKCFGTIERNENGQIIGVDLAGGRTSVDNETLHKVATLPHLKKLQISGAGLAKETLQQLESIPTLEELALQDTPTTDENLGRLVEKTPRLTRLRLRRLQNISDSGLAQLVQLQQLRVLALLEIPQLTQAGLQAIAPIPTLRSLDLRGCSSLRAEDYAVLIQMSQLRELKISSFAINDSVLNVVSQLPKLESLTIEDAKISQEQLTEFFSRPAFRNQIKNLGFSRMLGSVNDTTLAQLTACPQLRVLALKQIPVNGTFLTDWNGPLEILTLDRAMPGPDGIDAIAKVQSLKQLDLSGVYLPTDAIGTLSALEQLESLNLSDCMLQPEDLLPLEQFPKLRHVKLDGNPDLDETVLSRWNPPCL